MTTCYLIHPFGVDWKKIEYDIKDEHSLKGFNGRFGAGLPRVSDGSLLFLMQLISKMRDVTADNKNNQQEGGARIGIILNGSPLFTGGAGSGESEIRRYILEADLLEAIVALPTDMFYNTGIATYVWILSNKKSTKRKGKVQLINDINLCGKMRKSLGSKRNVMDESDIATITKSFGAFEVVDARALDKPAEVKSNRGRQSANPKPAAPKTFSSKIFDTHAFGYRRITVERPLRESYQFSDVRIEALRYANKPLNDVMQWVYQQYAQDWDAGAKSYGDLSQYNAAIRSHIKTHFGKLREVKIKELLDSKTWLIQLSYLQKAKRLQNIIGVVQYDDMNIYDVTLKAACKQLSMTLDAKEKKAITTAVSWKNPEAEKVIKKVHKNTVANPNYGLFKVNGKTLEYKSDGDLRDHENVALDPSQAVNELNEAYFKKEVQPHVPDAWIDATKKDAKDEQVGIVGYEIPFNCHFYEYQPPRDLAEIDADLDKVSGEIMELLREVHS